MEQLEQQRTIIQDDLRGLIAGDVLCDAISLQLYASDASIYEIRPLAVVRPQSLADVIACVQYAAEKHVPIHARGAGSGVAGESLGPGLVMDFSKNLRRVLRIDPETVRVQPGVVHERPERPFAFARADFRSGSGEHSRNDGGKHDRRGRRRQPAAEVRFGAPPRPQPANGVGRRSNAGAGPRAAGRGRERRSQSAKRDLVTRLAAALRAGPRWSRRPNVPARRGAAAMPFPAC